MMIHTNTPMLQRMQLEKDQQEWERQQNDLAIRRTKVLLDNSSWIWAPRGRYAA